MTQPVDGFGREISCTTALRSGVYVSGARLVAEAAYRRLTTPRGMLRGGDDEANYGWDLAQLIGSTPQSAAAIEGQIRNELSKDERIGTVTVDVVVTTSGPATAYDISISATTKDGPFTLTILVNDVTVQLLGLAA